MPNGTAVTPGYRTLAIVAMVAGLIGAGGGSIISALTIGFNAGRDTVTRDDLRDAIEAAPHPWLNERSEIRSRLAGVERAVDGINTKYDELLRVTTENSVLLREVIRKLDK